VAVEQLADLLQRLACSASLKMRCPEPSGQRIQ
jgi:hypothetical protein